MPSRTAPTSNDASVAGRHRDAPRGSGREVVEVVVPDP